jgi:hypothetical protein
MKSVFIIDEAVMHDFFLRTSVLDLSVMPGMSYVLLSFSMESPVPNSINTCRLVSEMKHILRLKCLLKLLLVQIGHNIAPEQL